MIQLFDFGSKIGLPHMRNITISTLSGVMRHGLLKIVADEPQS